MYFFVFCFLLFLHHVFYSVFSWFLSPEIKINEFRKKTRNIWQIQMSIKRSQTERKAMGKKQETENKEYNEK